MTMATAKTAIPERCAACDDCARQAYSDATTPGFFYDKCQFHRLVAAEAALSEAQRERDEIRSKFFNSSFDDSKTIRLLREQVTQQAATIERQYSLLRSFYSAEQIRSALVSISEAK